MPLSALALPEDPEAVDDPVGVTEISAPAQPRSDEADAVRRWMTGDDVALLLAPARRNDIPLAARLATHVDARDEHGWTLLMHAVLRGLPALVAELVEASADVGCQSTMLKRCEKLGAVLEFGRGSTALSSANACLDDGISEDSEPFLIVSMLRAPARHAGAAAERLSRRRGMTLDDDSEHAGAANRAWDPRDDPRPLASACSWLPASALPAHYRQVPTQPSESAEEAARREYRESVAESAVLRASGDFSGAVDGYKAAVRRYAGAPLRDDQYPVPEPQSSTGVGSFVVKRQSWDVANQQRTIEWKIS